MITVFYMKDDLLQGNRGYRAVAEDSMCPGEQ